MKLLTAEELSKKIQAMRFVTAKKSYGGDIIAYEVDRAHIDDVAEDILTIIKVRAYDAEETAEIASNLQKIAELEAKIFVYESFIKSAGFKLPREGKAKPE